MRYCFCTATIFNDGSPPATPCDGCLIAKTLIVGCGQGLAPCGGTTDIDLNALLNNPTDVVYSIKAGGYDPLEFASVSITAAGVLSVATGSVWVPHALQHIDYVVKQGKYKNYGRISFCFDNPCDEACGENCNTCNGTCYGTSSVTTDGADCGSSANTISIAAGLTLGACDGTSTYAVTVPDGISATIDAAGLITYDVDNGVLPLGVYRINWTLTCSLYGMITSGYVDVTITDLCDGVTCGAGQKCNPCTGVCDTLTSDLGGEKVGIGAMGGGSGATFG